MKEMKTKIVLVKVNTLTKRISFQSGKENYSDLKALEEEFNTLVSKDRLLSVVVGSSFHDGNYVFQVFDADFNEYVDIDSNFVIPEKCVLCFKSVEVPVGFHRQMLHQDSELRSITCLEIPPCSNSETILPTVDSSFSAEPDFGTVNQRFRNSTEPVSSSVTPEIQNDSRQYNVEYKTNSDVQKMLCNVTYDHSKDTCTEQFIDSYPMLEFDNSSTPSSTTSSSSQPAVIRIIELPVFSAAIQARIQTGNVLRYFHKFVRESAEHLVSIVPFPSKTIYDNYARALCNTFPELQDEYVGEDVHVSLRNHITKKVRNMRYSTQANRTPNNKLNMVQQRMGHSCEQPAKINEWQSSFPDAEENEAQLVCEPLMDSVTGTEEAAPEKAVTLKCEDVSMAFVCEPLEDNPQQDYSECRENDGMRNQEGNSCMEYPMINRRAGGQQTPLRNQISKSIPNFRYRYREPNKHSLDYQNFQHLQDQSVATSDTLEHCLNSDDRETLCLTAFKNNTNLSGDSLVTPNISKNRPMQFPVSRKKTCTLLMSSFRYKGTKNTCNGEPCMALPTFSVGVQNKITIGQLGSCYNSFVREAAAFFVRRYPWPTRQQYASYAKMLCDNYPEVKDKVTDGKYYLTLRSKIAKALRNWRYQDKRASRAEPENF